jgi:integrase
MPKKARELAAHQVRKLTRPGLHSVGGVAGLHLQVRLADGADVRDDEPPLKRSWILRIKIGDRRPDIGLGGFPDVTLEQARQRARETREQVSRGIDPLRAKLDAKAALRAAQAAYMNFAEAARETHATKAQEFRNVKHRAQWISSLEQHAFPVIGELPVQAIDVPHVLKVLQPLWTTSTETATRVRQRIEAVLAWATTNKYRAGPNPAAWSGNLEHALPKARKVKRVKHHPALPWQQVGEFMAKLQQRPGMGARALEFAILTAARSGEVRGATWQEIDLPGRLWRVPGGRMKAGMAHTVPLSDAAIELLKRLPKGEGTELLFPGAKGKPLSDATMGKVIRDAGVTDAVPHGFRSSFKDWARSSTNFPDEVSELALAHVASDATRAAYARDELLPQRAKLMQQWAKHCGTVRTADSATVVAIGKGRGR